MSTRGRTTTVAVVVTAITLIACGAVVVWVATSGRGPSADARSQPATEESARGATATLETDLRDTEPAGIRVYRAWQRRRADAWAQGDPVALRRLYVDPSFARDDVRQLRAWLARGATGVELTPQVLAYEVEMETETRVRLQVTQRVARARVHSEGPEVSLPRGRAVTQVVVLRRVGEQWRVARVSSTRTEMRRSDVP